MLNDVSCEKYIRGHIFKFHTSKSECIDTVELGDLFLLNDILRLSKN
jgi:hypothetical protein